MTLFALSVCLHLLAQAPADASPTLLDPATPAEVAAEVPVEAGPAEPAKYRGVAFPNWLTERVPHGDEDVAAVVALSANTVKLTVPFDLLDSRGAGLRLDAVAILDQMVGSCRTRQCQVILSCAAPVDASAFAQDRETRLRFVETWVALCAHYAEEPTVKAIIPLEMPSEVLTDARMYGDLSSYLCTEIREVAPQLDVFLAPLAGPGPDGAPVLSYENVGALCRLPAEMPLEDRAMRLDAASQWSFENSRPVLVDRFAAPLGAATEERDALIAGTLERLLACDPALSYVYDAYRVAGPSDSVALTFEADGVFRTDEGLAAVLKDAFARATPVPEVTPPPIPPTADVYQFGTRVLAMAAR